MKTIILSIVLALSYTVTNAQDQLFEKIKQKILEVQPTLSTENKLIAINYWSIENSQTRETNKNFEKAARVYEYAKLKGGTSGIIVVLINKTDGEKDTQIICNKDGIVKSICINASDLGTTDDVKNIVFDSSGKEVYHNLSSSSVFSTINSLITR